MTGATPSQVPLAARSLGWLLDAASDAMLICDAHGGIVLANGALARLFGHPHGSLDGKALEVLLPEGARAAHARLRDDFMCRPCPRPMGIGMELEARHAHGHVFPVEVSLSPLRDPEGTELVLATIHDISARKRAEHALQESEARMRAIFETAVDGIVTIDERGRMERLNPAAERMFGWREAEVAGRNVSMLMPEPHRTRHDGYLDHYLATGQPSIIGQGREVQGLRRDGTVFPMELAVAEMRIGGRRMFTGLVRDISARNAVEEEVRRLLREVRRLAAHQDSIKEQERRSIAREIHDELGGLLTGIKAYISVAAARATAAGAAPDPLLDDAAGLAQTAIETVRRVITDLRPSVLDQLGIWAALEWYAPQVAQRSNLACRCTIAEAAAALTLDDERSIMLFRIAQEALTNVVRHADATEVALAVRTGDGMLEMRVEDDGKGIGAAGPPLPAQDSWGILGMRERARRFGGEVTVAGRPGGGTCLLLRVPVEDRDG